MTTKTHPAAVEINGILYIHDAQGNLVPLANVKAVHLLEDEMVRKIVAYGEDLSAELARYSLHTDADIAAFDALLAQEYNVDPRETKGNRTFTAYDGLMRVQVAVAQRIKMGPALDDAKAVLDAMIRERGEGVDPFLITLIQRAFKVDQEGKVDVRAILALRRLDVDDPRWPDFCRAIDDAVQPDGSKRYIRIYRRTNVQSAWEMVPLDLAAVQPSPAALERQSLRRQIEEANAKLHEMWSDIPADLGLLESLKWQEKSFEETILAANEGDLLEGFLRQEIDSGLPPDEVRSASARWAQQAMNLLEHLRNEGCSEAGDDKVIEHLSLAIKALEPSLLAAQ
jgi:hypothetical protein